MGSNTQIAGSSSAPGIMPDCNPSGFKGGSPITTFIDTPAPNSWIVTPGGVATSNSLPNNIVSPTPLVVPTSCYLLAMGFNISGAGDATAVIRLSLYKKDIGQNNFRVVVPEQILNVGTSTGVQQVTFPAGPGAGSILLEPGRYVGVFRCIASVTTPQITANGGVPFMYGTAMDSTEAITDTSRGGLHPSDMPGYVSGLLPNTFSLQPATRATSNRMFLQVQPL